MVFIEDQPTIPTIDLSPFLSPSPPQSSRDAVITAVRSACQSYGFFQLTGHGIPLSLQRSILHCAALLFALPLPEKRAMGMSQSMGMSKRGYEAVGGQTLDVKPDTKEGFYIGVEVPAADPTAGTFLKGPNLWPGSLRAEDFRTPVMEYHRRVLGLHELLLRILAAGLSEQGKERMEGFMQDAVANIKLLHYPPNNAKEGAEQSIGAGAHTDFGCTTILLQQPEQHGLQVLYPPTQTWIPVPAQEDVFIVNIGDLLQKWTQGEYKSAVHRVVNVSTADRYSVPFFYHGNLSTRLSPLDGSVADGDAETVEEHIKGRFRKTFG